MLPAITTPRSPSPSMLFPVQRHRNTGRVTYSMTLEHSSSFKSHLFKSNFTNKDSADREGSQLAVEGFDSEWGLRGNRNSGSLRLRPGPKLLLPVAPNTIGISVSMAGVCGRNGPFGPGKPLSTSQLRPRFNGPRTRGPGKTRTFQDSLWPHRSPLPTASRSST